MYVQNQEKKQIVTCSLSITQNVIRKTETARVNKMKSQRTRNEGVATVASRGRT